jgi:heme/copper-type cytochrome/quinol oxidase subunit 1
MPTGDLIILGLTLQIVGIYFLASSIVFKRPKRILEEIYGIRKGSLRPVKDTVYRKYQIIGGFLFLMIGYIFQIYGVVRRVEAGSFFEQWRIGTVLVVLLVSIAAVTMIINLIGMVWTRLSFQRMLLQFCQQHADALTLNRALTKEMGEILGVPKAQDMTIDEYIAEIKERLRLNSAEISQQSRRLASRPR